MSAPNFIISHFTVFAIKRTKNGSSRGMPIHYNLPVGKHKVKVCKKAVFAHFVNQSEGSKVEKGIVEKPAKKSSQQTI